MIQEITSLSQLPSFCEPASWVFLDIDNTLFQTIHDWGSEEWETYLSRTFHSLGLDSPKAETKAALIWQAVQMIAPIQLTSPEIPSVLQQLTDLNIPYFFLTSRPKTLTPLTQKQLSHLGLLGARQIYHVGSTPKGALLSSLFSKKKSGQMILVDDRHTHLEQALSFFQNTQIRFQGLKYTNKRSSYASNPQADLIHRVLMDKQASLLLKKALEIW